MKIGTKERLVKMMEILKKETNEENMLSIDEIIERLREEFYEIYPSGYEVDRRTIKTDIERLKKINFYIEVVTGKYGKKLYYYAGEVFEMYEIRILLDAVYSARSITNKERENLLEKIKSLTSKSNSKVYDSKLYIPQMVISENKLLKYYLNEIHDTIYCHKKLKFQYGSYDISKNFNLHHDGDYYIVQPYNLVWHNDFYYLIAYDEHKKTIVNYRVDRMRAVEAMEDKFKIDKTIDVVGYLNSCFNMFPGKVETIEIKFVNKLINAIIDRFGKKVNIIDKDDDFFIIRIEAAINEGLVRWVLNWGGDAEIISPANLKHILKYEIVKMSKLYN